MITKNDFAPELLNNTDAKFVEEMEQFANTALQVDGEVIDEQTLKARLKGVHGIYFDDDTNAKLTCSKDVSAAWIPAAGQIVISSKYKNSKQILKVALYHELFHAISEHVEVDKDTINSTYSKRTGLNRGAMLFFPGNDTFFYEGDLLEEIMTEFYANQLLKHEGIVLSGERIKERFAGEYDYVDCIGIGYQDFNNLGRIYDFLFGQQLLQAKLFDGNNFRNNFNEVFGKAAIFDDVFPEEGQIPAYSKFVAQHDVQKRYETACKMFATLLKNKYKNREFNEKDLAQDESVNQFMNMLIKHRSLNGESTVDHRLYALMMNLQKDLSLELLGNKTEKEHSNVEAAVYALFKKILLENPNIKLKNIKYQTFRDSSCDYAVVDDGTNKYFINTALMGPNMQISKFQKMSDDIIAEFKSCNIDFSNSEFATLHEPLGAKSVIIKDGRYFDNWGKMLDMSSSRGLFGGSSKSVEAGH